MSAIKKPCIGVCTFNNDWCIGCGRSKQEIKAWKSLSKDEKRAALAQADMRLLTLAATGRRKKK